MTSAIPAPTARNHLIFWGAAFALFIGFVWLFNAMLLPFVLGLAIAYLLNPLVGFLGRHKIPRGFAAVLILGLFFIFLVTIIALAAPPLYREASELADSMPGYIERLSDILAPYINWLQNRFGNGDLSEYQAALQEHAGKAFNVGVGILGGLASGGQAFVGFISTLVLTPIVAFFMMREWPSITGWVDNLLPRKNYDTIRGLLKDIDHKLAGFVRGQLSVAFILGVFYALALTIAGLKFGFLIGLMAGALSIIPLVGSTIGLFVSVIVAWLQSGELVYTGIIAAIFLVGQFAEGNFITPKIMGESVGLHPLWILFALLAGGSLFGIVGMLLAIPVAAVIGVLLGFGLQKYKESAYYQDGNPTKKKA